MCNPHEIVNATELVALFWHLIGLLELIGRLIIFPELP